MDKVSELDRLAALKGRLILSGFRDNQENLLIESYQRLGWSLNRRLIKDFWHPELPADISFTWVAWWLELKLFEMKPQNSSNEELLLSVQDDRKNRFGNGLNT